MSTCRKEGDGIINSPPIMQVVRDISSNTIVKLKAILQRGSIDSYLSLKNFQEGNTPGDLSAKDEKSVDP